MNDFNPPEPPPSGCVLPAKVRKLVDSFGGRVVEAKDITRLRTNIRERATYFLRLDDGRAVKGRLVSRPAKADRMQDILSQMDERAFSRVLAHDGNAVLEEWINGVPLDRIRPDDSLLARCGAALADVHETPPVNDRWLKGVANREARMDDGLDLLAGIGILSRAERDQLRRFAKRYRPSSVEAGLVHRDFCAENLVLRAGRPCGIDNAAMSIGALDEDLARTWYRWPMSRRHWRQFLAGYATRRSPHSYLAHAPYWAVLVVVRASLFRHRAGASQLCVPVRLLTTFLTETWQRALR